MRSFLSIVILFLLPSLASASPLYAISWEVKQDATLLKRECEKLDNATLKAKSVESPIFDFCACTAKILYPQVNGLGHSEANQAINRSLSAHVEPDGCGTQKAYAPPAGHLGDRRMTRFDVTFANDHFLSFLFWHDSYAAGAAHNNWNVEGASYDLTTGKPLGLADLIAPEKLAEVNAKIAESLNIAYPGHTPPTGHSDPKNLADAVPSAGAASDAEEASDSETPLLADDDDDGDDTVTLAANDAMRDENDMTASDKPKGPEAYLSLEGCNGCTYHLTPEGLEVVFQLYEVAAFAEGNPKITIGREYLKKDISERL